MSVGLLVVRLLYCFYVFGHLSKWFTFSVLLSVIFCRVVVFYACTQRLSVWFRKGLRTSNLSSYHQKLMRVIMLENLWNPYELNTLLWAGFDYLYLSINHLFSESSCSQYSIWILYEKEFKHLVLMSRLLWRPSLPWHSAEPSLSVSFL